MKRDLLGYSEFCDERSQFLLDGARADEIDVTAQTALVQLDERCEEILVSLLRGQPADLDETRGIRARRHLREDLELGVVHQTREMVVNPAAQPAILVGHLLADREHRPVASNAPEIPFQDSGRRQSGLAFEAPMSTHLFDEVLTHDRQHGNAERDAYPGDDVSDRMGSADQERIPGLCLLAGSFRDFPVYTGVIAPDLIEIFVERHGE